MAEDAPAPAPEPSSRGLWIAIAVVIIVVVVVVAAIFAAPLLIPGPGQLRLATILDKSGGLAVFGGPNEQGAKLAIEQINDQGGVFGQDIAAFHEDSQTLPAAARDAATKVVSTDQVHAIVGSTGSGQCLTVLEVVKANDVPMISGSCTGPLFSDPTVNGGWFFRTAPSDALQGVVAGFYASDRGYTDVAVIGINNPYGTGLADVFADSYERFSGNAVTINRIVTEVTQGATSYIADLDAVFATNPQAIYLVAYPPDGILMMDEYAAGAYPAADWIFSEGLLSQSGFIDELVSRGIIGDIPLLEGTAPGNYVGLTGPRFAAWAADYEDRWGDPPGLFDDNVYDGTFLMALAAQKGGVASGSAIRDNLLDVANPPGTTILPGEWEKALTEIAAGRDVNYEGASGTTDLSGSGDPLISQYAVWGVDALNLIENRIIFDEDDVRGLLPEIPTPVSAPAFAASLLAPFRNN